MSAKKKETRMEGKDAFGSFTLTPDYCECGLIGPCVQYHELELPMEILVENTLLHEVTRPIGILCGCYAKFQRQVAHITDSIKHKGEPSWPTSS